MNRPTSKPSRITDLPIAFVLPLSMLLVVTVSPVFVLTYPLLASLEALRSGAKQHAVAGAIGLALCGGLLMATGAYGIGKTLAERDHAIHCPAASEVNLV